MTILSIGLDTVGIAFGVTKAKNREWVRKEQ